MKEKNEKLYMEKYLEFFSSRKQSDLKVEFLNQVRSLFIAINLFLILTFGYVASILIYFFLQNINNNHNFVDHLHARFQETPTS